MNSNSDFQHSGRVVEAGLENSLSSPSPIKRTGTGKSETVSPLKPSQKLNRMNEVADHPTKWEHIRELDEDEKWYERTQVVTKHEHQFYITCAEGFLEDILFKVTNDFNMPFVEQDEGNSEYNYMENFTDEDFNTAGTNFDVDYLEKLSEGSASDFKESAFARQSLYVKFDPLIDAKLPMKQQPTAQKLPEKNKLVDDLLVMDTPPAIQVKKASRVHFAEVDEQVLPSTHSHSAAKDISKDDSFKFEENPTTSVVNDTEGPLLASSEEELVKVLKFTEMDVARLVEERLAEERLKNDTLQKQIHLDYKEQLLALKEEKEVFRSQFALVVGEREELQSEIDKWKSVSTVAETSPLTLADKNSELKGNITQVQKQRDQALSDYEALEKSFGEFHNRYFKLKEFSQASKKRENHLKEQCSALNALVKEGEKMMMSMTEEMRVKQDEYVLHYYICG
jgi:hypothetical protein